MKKYRTGCLELLRNSPDAGKRVVAVDGYWKEGHRWWEEGHRRWGESGRRWQEGGGERRSKRQTDEGGFFAHYHAEVRRDLWASDEVIHGTRVLTWMLKREPSK